MRRIAALVAKDLRRRLAAPLGLILELAIPLAIAGTMALAFGHLGGSGGEEERAPKIRVVAVDLDDTPVSGFLAGASQNKEAARYLDIRRAASREEGMEKMRDEDLAAMLVIPEGFGEALLGGSRAELELVKNPSQSIMPVVAQQGTEVVALYASAASRFLGDDAARLKEMFEGRGWNDAVGIGAMAAGLYSRVKAADSLLFPPIVEVKTEKAAGEKRSFDLIGWMFPGVVVMGLFFVGVAQMRDLLRERELGTLRRVLTAPVSATQVLLAKVAAVALVVALAMMIFVLAGALLFGVRWGAPAPLLAVSVLIVLAVTGFSALLFSVARTERQGDAFGGILVVLMALIGGAFVPPQLLPGPLQSAARFTVNYWGQEALRALGSGGGWEKAAEFVAPLAAMGVIFTALGVALLARRHVRGAL